jgi:hypothetical protein
MKKFILVTTLVIMVSLLVVVPAFAATQSAPLGRCRPGFSMVLLSKYPSISSSADVNGDGYVCIRPRATTPRTYIVADNFLKIKCQPHAWAPFKRPGR